jgi:hypothetical protein
MNVFLFYFLCFGFGFGIFFLLVLDFGFNTCTKTSQKLAKLTPKRLNTGPKLKLKSNYTIANYLLNNR